MRFFYDPEFLDDGSTIRLISIGIVAEDGREYYAVNRDAPWHEIREHPWLMANVVPHLPKVAIDFAYGVSGISLAGHPTVKPRWRIAHEVSEFIRAAGENRDDHELFAYYSAYDHVVLAQLFGPMVNLPPWVPMYTNDLKSGARALEKAGFPAAVPPNPGEHNALEDARWNRRYYQHQVEASQQLMASGGVPAGHVAIAEPTAARLIERMLSVGPDEGISDDEERDLRAWWDGYVYPPGEPEAGGWPEEEVSDEEQAAMESQQDAEDRANDAEHARRVAGD